MLAIDRSNPYTVSTCLRLIGTENNKSAGSAGCDLCSMNCVLKNDEFCVRNDELCISNDGLCIKHDDFDADLYQT